MRPADFIPAVYGRVHAAGREHGDVLLRLGVTGTGKLPNYRLESPDGSVIEAFDGNNHQPWPTGSSVLDGANWSSATMTLAEVEALLSEERRLERRR